MKLPKLLKYLFLICSITVNSQTHPIYKTAKAPCIDGNLSDWNLPFSGPFVIHNSAEKATQNTFVALAWDNDFLYLAYNCVDTKIVGSKKKQDAPIFKSDDLIEFFLDPDGDGQNYLEIGVNAYATFYDLLIKCVSPDCGGWKNNISFAVANMQTASKINKTGYSVEIRIPFSSLVAIKNGGFSIPTIGTKWKGNAFRIDYGSKTEYLSLTPYTGSKFGFHQPTQFATFEFKGVFKKDSN
jgi:hypothetical protein